MKETLNSKLYILVVIGIVSAFGPFVTDFYLPALPVLAGYYLLPIATRIVRSRWSSYFQIHRHGSLRRERAYSLFFYA